MPFQQQEQPDPREAHRGLHYLSAVGGARKFAQSATLALAAGKRSRLAMADPVFSAPYLLVMSWCGRTKSCVLAAARDPLALP